MLTGIAVVAVYQPVAPRPVLYRTNGHDVVRNSNPARPAVTSDLILISLSVAADMCVGDRLMPDMAIEFSGTSDMGGARGRGDVNHQQGQRRTHPSRTPARSSRPPHRTPQSAASYDEHVQGAKQLVPIDVCVSVI